VERWAACWPRRTVPPARVSASEESGGLLALTDSFACGSSGQLGHGLMHCKMLLCTIYNQRIMVTRRELVMTTRVGMIAAKHGWATDKREKTTSRWLQNKTEAVTKIGELLNDEHTTIYTRTIDDVTDSQHFKYLGEIRFMFYYVTEITAQGCALFKIPANPADEEIEAFRTAITDLFQDPPSNVCSSLPNEVMSFNKWTYFQIRSMFISPAFPQNPSSYLDTITNKMQRLNLAWSQAGLQRFKRMFFIKKNEIQEIFEEINYFENILLSFLVQEKYRTSNKFVTRKTVLLHDWNPMSKTNFPYFVFDIKQAMIALEKKIKGLFFYPGGSLASSSHNHPFFLAYPIFVKLFAGHLPAKQYYGISYAELLKTYQHLATSVKCMGIIKNKAAEDMMLSRDPLNGISKLERLEMVQSYIEDENKELKQHIENITEATNNAKLHIEQAFDDFQREKKEIRKSVLELQSKLNNLIWHEGEAAT
jgi:hypothetical protein